MAAPMRDLSCLPEEGVLCAIAVRVAPSQRSIEAMRAVCRHWRRSIPPMRGPWLVLSPMDMGQATVFLGIEGGFFVRQIPLFLPPRAAVCWSCCRSLMALREAGRAYSLCVSCGGRDATAQHPDGERLTNFCKIPRLVCAISQDSTSIWWTTEEDDEWFAFDYGLGIEPKSVDYFSGDGIACIAAAPASLILDSEFENRLAGLPDELEEVFYDAGMHYHPQPPAVIGMVQEEDDPKLLPVGSRGHHVFNIDGEVFLCLVLRHAEDAHLELRLFSLETDHDWDNAALTPAFDIGNNSVFLGCNQAFAMITGHGLLHNTAYVVNDEGFEQEPSVIAINFFSGNQTTLLYPADIGPVGSYMPGSWLAPLPEEDVDWRCD